MPDWRDRTIAGLAWFAQRWGIHWAVASTAAIPLILLPASAMVLGATSAYSAESAATIVTTEEYAQVVGANGGYPSLARAVVALALVLPLVGLFDAAGRVVYAHLLWVPRGVWVLAGYVILLLPAGIVLLNCFWALWELLAEYRQSVGGGDAVDG